MMWLFAFSASLFAFLLSISGDSSADEGYWTISKSSFECLESKASVLKSKNQDPILFFTDSCSQARNTTPDSQATLDDNYAGVIEEGLIAGILGIETLRRNPAPTDSAITIKLKDFDCIIQNSRIDPENARYVQVPKICPHG